jgi:hypothetical protein
MTRPLARVTLYQRFDGSDHVAIDDAGIAAEDRHYGGLDILKDVGVFFFDFHFTPTSHVQSVAASDSLCV